MDFISIEKGENLFWLGRYVERVYRTLGPELILVDSVFA